MWPTERAEIPVESTVMKPEPSFSLGKARDREKYLEAIIPAQGMSSHVLSNTVDMQIANSAT
jgi:hypothetical protein